MKSQKSTFTIFIIAVVLLVIGLGIFVSYSQNKPSKYTDFANTLKTDGAQFYGAFWCPHCAEQEADFGMTRQALESIGLYKECSNPDRSPTKICTDKKVESFPTWMFKDGITITSSGDPTICKVGTTVDIIKGEPPICSEVASQFFSVYVFPNFNFSVRSPVAPTHTGDVWKFPPEASTAGVLTLSFIASQVGYILPN